MKQYLKISYVEANDVGPIYLEDVQQRSQLGAGLQKLKGQDIVINPSDVIFLVNTGAVLMSVEKGTLGHFSTTEVTTEVQSTSAETGDLEYTVFGSDPLVTVYVDDDDKLADVNGDYIDETGAEADPAVTANLNHLTATMEDVTAPVDPDAPLIIEEVDAIVSGDVVRTGIPTDKTDPSNTVGDF